MRMNENAIGSDVWKEFDRLWENDPASERDIARDERILIKKNETDTAIPEWLKTISEIDSNIGLKNCGGLDGYLSVLSAFHKTAPYKADEIEKLFSDEDMKNYTIKVHALKSSSRIIGAKELADLAEKLEEAGNKNDLLFTKDNTGILLEMYRKLDEELSAMDSQNGDLPMIAPSEMKEAYQTMIEIAQSMDYEMMYGLLNQLRQYRLESEDNETVRVIEKLLTELEWEKIEDTAKTKIIAP